MNPNAKTPLVARDGGSGGKGNGVATATSVSSTMMTTSYHSVHVDDHDDDDDENDGVHRLRRRRSRSSSVISSRRRSNRPDREEERREGEEGNVGAVDDDRLAAAAATTTTTTGTTTKTTTKNETSGTTMSGGGFGADYISYAASDAVLAAATARNIPSAVVASPIDLESQPLSINGSDDDDEDGDGDAYRLRPAFAEHLGKHRQYWRDIILGVNDGLVSTYLLVAGVSGGGLSTKDVLLTAVAGSIAGAVSMYAGEYVATKSQNEVLTGEIELEHHHVRHYRSDEMRELSDLLALIGLPRRPTDAATTTSPSSGPEGLGRVRMERGGHGVRGEVVEGGVRGVGAVSAAAAAAAGGGGGGADANDNNENENGNYDANSSSSSSSSRSSNAEEGWDLHRRMMSYYERNGDALLKIMVALEFGVVEEETRNPCAAGLTSCGLFFLGSLPSVVPFALVEDCTAALVAAGVATGVALFVVGAVKTWATRSGWVSAAVENFVIAGVGGAFAYGVGVGFDRLIRKQVVEVES